MFRSSTNVAAAWRPDMAVGDTRTAWHVAIGAIVGGHIVAVWLAPVTALRMAPSRGLAIRGLLPLTLLMVVYAGASIAILADPITRFRMPDPGYTRNESPAVRRAGRDRSETTSIIGAFVPRA